MRGVRLVGLMGLVGLGIVASCGEPSHPPVEGALIPDAGGSGSSSSSSSSSSGGSVGSSSGTFGPPVPASDDPKTCAEAAASKSYVGCDYWPTVTANNVWSIFDYAVVVANAGDTTAQITVTGPGGARPAQSVAPGALVKTYLPWVSALKGADADACGTSTGLSGSVVARASAYHLVSSVPVIVTQFNALEYKGQGGPPGKSWASCPGNTTCNDKNSSNYGTNVGCYSFTNDSSLLLPSTALTCNVRVVAYPGESESSGTSAVPIMASTLSITAVANATHVKVLVAKGADIAAGTGVTRTPAGGELDLTLDAGDVAQLVTDPGDTYDWSGTLVKADQPVQVITGAPCAQVPETAPACDHLEQSVFPAETLGKRYFVTVPTGPTGKPIGHVVRLVGNVDGTSLTYAPAAPGTCPTKLDAGQVVDCGTVGDDFEVTGDHEFVVSSFQLGGTRVDPGTGLGDPSQSLFASVEQYRVKYVFLAPDDYSENWMDVVEPTGTQLWLDGVQLGGSVTTLADGYGVQRVSLSTGSQNGAHTLLATKPVGIQVLGYGEYTSYQYPGGLNLTQIAPPPVTQ